jgi:hypothetical protein
VSNTLVTNKLVILVVMAMLAVALVFGGTAIADQCIGCGGGKQDNSHHKNHNNPNPPPPPPLPPLPT